MAEQETLPQSGEPGTIAVDVGEHKGKPRGTYQADQTGIAPKLRVSNLSVTYIDRKGNRTEAVRDVSFDVFDKPDVGEVVVFLGPSGCGKSTILKAVAGLLPPTEGDFGEASSRLALGAAGDAPPDADDPADPPVAPPPAPLHPAMTTPITRSAAAASTRNGALPAWSPTARFDFIVQRPL